MKETKREMKKFGVFAFALLMLLMLMPALKAEAAVQGDWEYTVFEDGISPEGKKLYSVEILRYNGSGGNVVIPSTLGGYPVRWIGVTQLFNETPFYECKTLTSVVIPENVQSIGQYAFYGCTSLKKVNLPNSLSYIGFMSFGYCKYLEEIVIPKNVSNVEYGAFAHCTSLSEIKVASGNESYVSEGGVLIQLENPWQSTKKTLVQYPAGKSGAYAIPNDVPLVGIGAFLGCSSLTSITIPASVTMLAEGVYPKNELVSGFSECDSLTSITVAEGNKIYASHNGVLYNKSKTNLIKCPTAKSGAYTVPNGVKVIESQAFSSCAKLTSVTLPEGLITIDYMAFWRCSALKKINIPNSVEYVGESAFSESGIEELLVGDGNKKYSSHGGVLFNKSGSTLAEYPAGKKDTEYVINNSKEDTSKVARQGIANLGASKAKTTAIAAGAFKGNKKLKTVLIPKNVTQIGEDAFKDSQITILCYSGSFAQKYAKNNKIPYKVIQGNIKSNKKTVTKDTVRKGKTLTLKATGNATIQSVKWTTSKKGNVKIAKGAKSKTVTLRGMKKGGKSVVKATITFADGTTMTKKCTITVK